MPAHEQEAKRIANEVRSKRPEEQEAKRIANEVRSKRPEEQGARRIASDRMAKLRAGECRLMSKKQSGKNKNVKM